jgi:hypothetical protein
MFNIIHVFLPALEDDLSIAIPLKNEHRDVNAIRTKKRQSHQP